MPARYGLPRLRTTEQRGTLSDHFDSHSIRPMPTDPPQGPTTGPFSQPTPRPTFAPRAPLYLPHLTTYPASAGTRFGMYASRKAPTDPAKVALLLSIVGYDVRRDAGIEIRGASGKWMAAPTHLPTDPLLCFLRCAYERDGPARPMDPNDERLDVVFAGA
jgi:hypothetical protein